MTATLDFNIFAGRRGRELLVAGPRGLAQHARRCSTCYGQGPLLSRNSRALLRLSKEPWTLGNNSHSRKLEQQIISPVIFSYLLPMTGP